MKLNTRKNVIGNSILYLILTIFAIVMILPFYWTILTSIRYNEDMFSLPIKWFITRITFEHYANAFTTVPYAKYFGNSLFLATMGVLTNLFFGSLGGYAFAKLKFRGKNTIFKILLSSIMVPGVVTMIPQFLLLKNFPLIGGNNILGSGGIGFLNTYWAIILPGAAGAFAVFLMRQFFLSLPDDLAESARIEGAGEFRIFWNIYLPLTKPALAALSIFTFQGGWNNFMWPMIILNDPEKYTIQMALQSFSFNHATEYGPMMAASIVATLPIFILFIFAQKYFVQGIAFAGIKG
jgi:multiple sugar transport system permease protein